VDSLHTECADLNRMNHNRSNRAPYGEKRTGQGRAARQSYNPGLTLKDVLFLLDAEIARFKAARAFLAVGATVTVAPRKAGRPPKVHPASPKVPKGKSRAI